MSAVLQPEHVGTSGRARRLRLGDTSRACNKSHSPSRFSVHSISHHATFSTSKSIKRKKSSTSVNAVSTMADSSGDETQPIQYPKTPPSTPALRTNSKRLKENAKEKEDRHHTYRHSYGSRAISLPASASHSTQLSIVEAERDSLRKEVEALRQALHDSKRNNKKQMKNVDELKNQINTAKITRKSHEVQIQTLKTKGRASEELIATIETALQCQICLELLINPFAISPCGHILCLGCLQEWFRKAPPSCDDMDIDPLEFQQDPQYIMRRPKSCPCCRAIVIRRPVPVFIVKSVSSALVKAKFANDPDGHVFDTPASMDEDPWKGIFREEEDDEDDDMYSDGVEEYDYDYSDEDAGALVPWLGIEFGFNPDMAGLRLEDPEVDDSSAGSDDGDPDDIQTSSDEESYQYVTPRWQPPCIHNIDELQGISDFDVILVRRGCTVSMINAYGMEYAHQHGLMAYVDTLSVDEFTAPTHRGALPGARKRAMHRIFLGWNVNVDPIDIMGHSFMSQIVRDINHCPERWDISPRPLPRPRADRVVLLDAYRLVRDDIDETYDTTSTEEWIE